MLPEKMAKKSKKDDEAVANRILTPKFENKLVCCSCKTKEPAGMLAVLFKDSNTMQTMCSGCASNTMISKDVTYQEDLETYHRRLKVGYFKDWRLDEKNK